MTRTAAATATIGRGGGIKMKIDARCHRWLRLAARVELKWLDAFLAAILHFVLDDIAAAAI